MRNEKCRHTCKSVDADILTVVVIRPIAAEPMLGRLRVAEEHVRLRCCIVIKEQYKIGGRMLNASISRSTRTGRPTVMIGPR